MKHRSALFKGSVGLLAASWIVLAIALFLTWWTVSWIVPPITQPPPSITNGFSGLWGWVSLASWIALTFGFALRAPRSALRAPVWIRHIASMATMATEIKGLGVTAMLCGALELAGNLLFISAAPKTHIAMPGQIATRGIGLDLAMACGLAIVVGGALMLASVRRSTRAMPLPPGPRELDSVHDVGGRKAT